MNKLVCVLVSLLLIHHGSSAQLTRYVVKLTDKGATSFTLSNPTPYLSQHAIDRRSKYQIAIDSSDLPVPVSYINQIKSIPNLIFLNSSRWLNAVTIQTTDASALTALDALPFVQSVTGIAGRSATVSPRSFEETITATANRGAGIDADYFNYGSSSFDEIHLHWGEFLHNVGLRGQGMQIAMLDGGFFAYNSYHAFDSVVANNQVLSTWDFVARNATVTDDNTHGMMCFSTIAANIPGQFIGKAPKASFHLFRTEDISSEYPIEEFNWACGAERADSSGADVLSSSLGYGYEFNSPVPDYPYSLLNGDLTMAAIAADLAAKKGILVLNSAGNSGNDYWKMITTPADADSIIAVGAVSVDGTVGSFSSYGPSADGRVKPDLASVGVNALVQTSGNTVGTGNGTSFACPNLAGLATCLWQGFPEFNNMHIIDAMKRSGSIYTNPDTRIGYGIPNMKTAFAILLADFATSSVTQSDCNSIVSWTSKDVGSMRYEVQRKAPGETGYSTIAEISADAGTILGNHDYQVTSSLNGFGTGIVSYRIRQVIDTASSTLTTILIDTADLQLTSPCTGTDADRVWITPNPSRGETRLLIETAAAIENLSIMMYDMRGTLVYRFRGSKAAGLFSMSLPSLSLPAGKYIIVVNDNQRRIGKAELLHL